jgi:hypothetical protein
MIPAGPLFHKPKSIIAARNILYTALFLEALVFIIQQFISTTPGQPDIRVLFPNGILLVFLYVAIRYIGFGKKWARILFLVLFILNVLASKLFVPFLFKTNLALGFLFVLQMLLQILALVFLYSKSSNEWFNSFDSENTSERKL